MERIAIVSDIHGNMTAWEAVWKDIQQRGIERIFCLGDLVGKGPQPAEAVDQIRAACEVVVRGNWDELVAVNQDVTDFTWQAERLGADRVAYLASLPFSYELKLSGRDVRFVHASPQSVYHRVQPWDEMNKRLAMFEPPADEAGSGLADVVGYGDVHNAFCSIWMEKCCLIQEAWAIRWMFHKPRTAFLKEKRAKTNRSRLTCSLFGFPMILSRKCRLHSSIKFLHWMLIFVNCVQAFIVDYRSRGKLQYNLHYEDDIL